MTGSSLGNDVPHIAVEQSAVYWSCQWVCPLHARMSPANKTTDQLWLESHRKSMSKLSPGKYRMLTRLIICILGGFRKKTEHTSLFYFMQIYYCTKQNSYYRSEAIYIHTKHVYIHTHTYIYIILKLILVATLLGNHKQLNFTSLATILRKFFLVSTCVGHITFYVSQSLLCVNHIKQFNPCKYIFCVIAKTI